MHAKTIHTNLDINPINVSAPIYLDLKKIHPKTFEKLIASPKFRHSAIIDQKIKT